LRVDRSSLSSIDKRKAREELVAMVLEGCYNEKIEEKKEYLKELVVLLVLAWREEMKIEDVELFLLDRLNEKLIEELKKKLFDTKPLNSFSFSKLSNLANDIE
jgi:hypothetical protein